MNTNDALAARAERLAERARAGYPEPWRAEQPGDTLAGASLRLEQAHTARGPAHVAVIEQPDGRARSLFLFHAALRSQLAKARPEPGDVIAVVYEGPRESGSGQRYESWRVVSEKAAGRVDWSRLAVDADTELAAPAAPARSDVPAGLADDDDIPF